MNARGSIPFGRAGVIVMAAALVPVVIKKARPFSKIVGNAFVNLGRAINEMADADGIRWWKVQTPAGEDGWASGEYLARTHPEQ